MYEGANRPDQITLHAATGLWDQNPADNPTVTTNHLKIGYPHLPSTGTRVSDEPQGLGYMTGHKT